MFQWNYIYSTNTHYIKNHGTFGLVGEKTQFFCNPFQRYILQIGYRNRTNKYYNIMAVMINKCCMFYKFFKNMYSFSSIPQRKQYPHYTRQHKEQNFK